MTVNIDLNDLKSLDISTLFGKLIKHEHELKRLKAREANLKKKEKVNEDKRRISLKVSSSKVKVKDDEDSSKDEEIIYLLNDTTNI